MPYTITRYQLAVDPDGRFPFTLPDNTIDSTHTTIDLIGKGVSNYGQPIADDLVWMLENFAGPNSPANPITGQAWYDTTDQIMKVFNSVTGWTNIGSFSSDSNTITNTTINGNPVLTIIINGTIAAIWSANTFTPTPPIAGFSVINSGINLNTSLSPLPFFNNGAGAGSSILTTSGNFTTPPTTNNLTLFKFMLTGGGGGGSSSGGGGGAAGTTIYYTSGLLPSVSYSCTIGTGGATSSNGNNSSMVIGAVSLTANGGLGANTAAGAGGGTSSGVPALAGLNLVGGFGQSQYPSSFAGSGGTSYWGPGGGPDTAGVNPGSGGGGHQSGTAGVGANGILSVEWK